MATEVKDTAKHTAAPWIVSGYRICGPLDARSKHRNGRVLIGGVVDDVNDWRGAPSESIDERSAFAAETKSNARVISCAPELLAEVKSLAYRLRNCILHTGSDPEFADGAVAAALALIAKAEGRAEAQS